MKSAMVDNFLIKHPGEDGDSRESTGARSTYTTVELPQGKRIGFQTHFHALKFIPFPLYVVQSYYFDMTIPMTRLLTAHDISY